jgi:hypothetical protein
MEGSVNGEAISVPKEGPRTVPGIATCNLNYKTGTALRDCRWLSFLAALWMTGRAIRQATKQLRRYHK